MKIYQLVAQGDLLLIPVEEAAIPAAACPIERRGGRLILAEGEVTGHAHTIEDALAELVGVSGEVDRWLRTGGRATLRHEEHGAITLDAPAYIVRTQSEYDPETVRRVAD